MSPDPILLRSAESKGLDDRVPILMFPLRLETRFSNGQLWVRVYPDDCLIDSFQPNPSQTEVANVRRYWTAMWKARGIEAQQRGAWRALVASHGSGRAKWLTETYRPLNSGEAPADPDLLALIIPTDDPPSPQEMVALKTYWAAAWRADDNRDEVEAAMAAFDSAIADPARAAKLLEMYKPSRFADELAPGVDRKDAQVAVIFLVFPSPGQVATETLSWNTQAQVRLLPERLVLVGWKDGAQVLEVPGAQIPSPLPAGPDPQATGADQISIVNGELVMPDDLRWLTDFQRAVDIGMGFRVDLTAQTEAGFDQLMVVGVRQNGDPAAGQQLLEQLLAHHRDGTTGFEILPQGTPTNNSEDRGSGYSRADDADAAFDALHNPGTPLSAAAAWNAKRDGEWLAEALGIDYGLLDSVAGSRNTDQLEAQAMNVALWPATLGYALQSMLHPLLEDADIARVRWFAERFVTGRGLLPAIRLGRQPYGVLPATALSRLTWTSQELPAIPGIDTPAGAQGTLAKLNHVLGVIGADWAGMAQKVSRVGAPGADPQQTLLDILGLQASSVAFDQRFAESVEDLYNRMRFYGWGAELIAALEALAYQASGTDLLKRLGYAGTALPDALSRLFLKAPSALTGPAIDQGPLSEIAALPAVTATGNYIAWLRATAATSLDSLRQEQGFTAGQPPIALLYLLLRHSLLLSYWDSGLRLSLGLNVLNAAQVKAARMEPPFVHVAQNTAVSESRYQLLYARDGRLTANRPVTVGEFLTSVIGADSSTNDLQRMLAALDVLAPLPTARLERLFAEHLDLCTYRLDAWQQGLVHYGLALSRYSGGDANNGRRTGIYLGAFGWLEQVKPKARALTPAGSVAGVDPSFFAQGQPPLMSDPTNGGYIHAPSLNQAVAAAVLRSGYLANAQPANAGSFAVDLSSRRVRLALSFLDGIRQGQSLGALLGYQLERSLHDSYAFAEVDQFIYALRGKFPLASGRDPDTAASPVEAVEANNVVDGLQLVNYLKPLAVRTYPFGLPGFPAASAAQAQLIDAAVEQLLYAADAVADLNLAEGVYEAVLSNYDAAAASLDASGQAQLPPEPRVVQTPRSGRTVTHRFAVHLEAGLDESVSPIAGMSVTPRALLEPAVNRWLSRLLPAPDKVGCTVRWFDPAGGTLQSRVVTQKDLGLQPIDLLAVASQDTSQALSELDSRVVLFAERVAIPRPDCAATIQYQTPIPGLFTFADVAPMIRHLKPLITQARALQPADVAPPGAATTAMNANISVKPSRVTEVRDAMVALRQDLSDFCDALAPLHEPEVRLPQVLAGLDAQLDQLSAMLTSATAFALPASDPSSIPTFRSGWFNTVLDVARQLADRFTSRLAEADSKLAAYDAAHAGMTNAQRIAALLTAERSVRATITIPQPTNAVAYRNSIGASRNVFAARRDAIQAMLASSTRRTTDVRAAFQAILIGPPSIEDLDPLPVSSLLTVLEQLADRFSSRLADADAKLADYDATQAGLTDPQRFAALNAAELSVRAALTDPQPATAVAYRATVASERNVFNARLAAIRTLLASAVAPNVDLWTPFQAILDGPPTIDELDAQPVGLPQFEAACVRASADLLARARSVLGIIDQRLAPAGDLITQAAAAADPGSAAKLLVDAGKKLLGDDALLLPEFSADTATGAAFLAASSAAAAGDPLEWQRTVAKTPEPMDTWLYGVARVREKVRRWESAVMLTEALGGRAPDLLPVQVPWRAGDHWLGLEFPEGFAPSSERLCYTAHFEAPFDSTRPQCGLLLDEWTEVIPGSSETTGLAFHYDRPNAEAPQVLMVLTPPRFTGVWHWNDVVDGVRETFERAKSRLVEPDHVDQSAYARFLPMTAMAVTLHQVSIMTNLARNNLFAAVASDA